METQKNIQEVRQVISGLDVATLCPLHFDFSGNMKQAKGYFAVYNLQKDKYCCAVSKEYQVIQHRDFFNSFLDSLDRLNIPYSAKVFSHKNRAYMDINFIGQNIKFDKLNEEFSTGIRLMNSYDKTTGVKISAKFTRLACSNGMVVSRFSDVVNSKHNSVALTDMDKYVTNGLNMVIGQNEKLQNWVSESMTDSIEWQQGLKVICALFKEKKHRVAILEQLGISTITEGKKSDRKISYTAISQELAKLSRWNIYNAITYYCSHNEKLRVSQEVVCQKIAERVLTTNLIELPQKEAVIIV